MDQIETAKQGPRSRRHDPSAALRFRQQAAATRSLIQAQRQARESLASQPKPAIKDVGTISADNNESSPWAVKQTHYDADTVKPLLPVSTPQTTRSAHDGAPKPTLSPEKTKPHFHQDSPRPRAFSGRPTYRKYGAPLHWKTDVRLARLHRENGSDHERKNLAFVTEVSRSTTRHSNHPPISQANQPS